jgi:hypothetical protein
MTAPSEISFKDLQEQQIIFTTPPVVYEKFKSGGFNTPSGKVEFVSGLHLARLLEREENELVVTGLDAVDGTPIIDIKPYIPQQDIITNAKVPSWVDKLNEGKDTLYAWASQCVPKNMLSLLTRTTALFCPMSEGEKSWRPTPCRKGFRLPHPFHSGLESSKLSYFTQEQPVGVSP